MGLDATVYLNLKSLPVHLRARVIIDPKSGEISLRDSADERIFNSSQFQAWHERIGNIALVAVLREEIAEAFGNHESLLSKKVVYSGSHAGDHVPFSEINVLSREIDELERITSLSRSAELTAFIVQMRKLIEAANRECNGIVF